MSDLSESIDRETLLDLFKHFDDIAMSKENLFIPVSLAVVPAVILNWDNMQPQTIIVAAIASLSLYGYLLLVISRYGAIQNNIFGRFRAYYSDFDSLMKYPRGLSIRPLRYYLFFILIQIWILLYAIKAGVYSFS